MHFRKINKCTCIEFRHCVAASNLVLKFYTSDFSIKLEPVKKQTGNFLKRQEKHGSKAVDCFSYV